MFKIEWIPAFAGMRGKRRELGVVKRESIYFRFCVDRTLSLDFSRAGAVRTGLCTILAVILQATI